MSELLMQILINKKTKQKSRFLKNIINSDPNEAHLVTHSFLQEKPASELCSTVS